MNFSKAKTTHGAGVRGNVEGEKTGSGLNQTEVKTESGSRGIANQKAKERKVTKKARMMSKSSGEGKVSRVSRKNKGRKTSNKSDKVESKQVLTNKVTKTGNFKRAKYTK